MSSLAITFIVFVCVFGSALVGCYLRIRLPEHHLSADSLRAVSLAIGLVATLAAMVLGLLTASAKSSFDKIDDGFRQVAARVVMLDRVLANYGPESKEARDLLRSTYATVVELVFATDGSHLARLDGAELENFQSMILELAPRNESQRRLQARALELGNDLTQIRSLLIAQSTGTIATPLLVILVLWLGIIFAGFGVLTANNLTVVAALFVCALAVSGSIFLVEEMSRPLEGFMRLPSAPQLDALSQLGK
jgi:hypothetical protein